MFVDHLRRLAPSGIRTTFALATLCPGLVALQADEQARSPCDVLLVVEPHASPAWNETVEAAESVAFGSGVVARVGSDEISRLPGSGSHEPLRVFLAGRRRGAQEAWWLRFNPVTGVFRVRIFDVKAGLSADTWTKVRSVTGEKLEESHHAKVLAACQEARTSLEQERADLESSEEPTAQDPWAYEDPVLPGFEWEYRAEGVFVVQVYPESSLGEAGLTVGDHVLQVNSIEVPGPAVFGRAIGPLRAGQPLVLKVRRGDDTEELKAKVHSASELLPRYYAAILGQPVADLLGEEQAKSLGLSGEGPVRVVIVANSRKTDSLDDLPVYRFLADQGDKKIRVIGIGRDMDPGAVESLKQQLAPGFDFLADPDSSISRSLRITDVPTCLVIDSKGVLRFRPSSDVELHRCLRRL